MISKVNRFLRRLAQRTEIVTYLAIARFMIRFLPYAWWKKTLGPIGTREEIHPATTLTKSQLQQVQSISRNILQMAHWVPFDAVCLPQAMTGRWMLNRRGIASEIFLGARKGTGKKPVDLHAWLMVDDRCVTGESERSEFNAFKNALQS